MDFGLMLMGVCVGIIWALSSYSVVVYSRKKTIASFIEMLFCWVFALVALVIIALE